MFGEDQSRYLIEINEKNREKVCKILKKNSIYYEIIGKTQKENLELNEEFSIRLKDLNRLSSDWFRNYFKEN